MFQFADNNVIIPIYVIEELDQFKKHANQLGRNARQAARYIDQFRQKGNLSGEGVVLNSEGTLRVLFSQNNNKRVDGMFKDKHMMDNKILTVALEVHKEEPDLAMIVISKDTNLRIRANALGLRAEDYEPEVADIDELYTGTRECLVASAVVDELFDQKTLSLEVLRHHIVQPSGSSESKEELTPVQEAYQDLFSPNQFLWLQDVANEQHTALARIEPDGKQIVPLSRRSKDSVWGIRARNKEQSCALDLLLDDRIKLVTLVGKAGTGKTLVAIAAGLQCTVEEGLFQKLLVSRPVLPMGRDIGYLPGSMEDKLTPWMQPIIDNVEFLMGINQQDRRQGRGYHELIDIGMLQIEPLTYIRGRSIPQQYMIVDEAQNLTPHEVKTIVSRAGEGTKIILTGDPYQIDHPYVDAANNGLVHTVNRFIEEGIAGHITLQKGERSDLAELAANLL